ncbi:MAG: ribosome maturation factor RimP [Acidimicrobiia bacterium]
MVTVPDLDMVRSVAGALLKSRGLDLVDVELEGSGRARTLRILVERGVGASAEPVDLGVLAEATTPISQALDAVEVVRGPYTLEVSSPGLERPLRRPGDFRRFMGTTVTVKSDVAVDGARRHKGLLVEADDDGIALDVDGCRRRLVYDQIASARTVFEWGPAPKPGSRSRQAKHDERSGHSAGERTR